MAGIKNGSINRTRSKTTYAILGGICFFLFGLGLAVIGGRLILYQYLLAHHSRQVIGEIIDSGSVRGTSSGYINFIRYRFEDESGKAHTGQSSGYSGEIGETVLLEYSSGFPFIHRVSGEGKTKGYKWRWAIFCAGLLFAAAGIHWFIHTRGRVRLAARLRLEGISVKSDRHRITDGGRTITYHYTTDAGSFRGKTLALPVVLVRKQSEKERVDVLYDPQSHKRSVLKIEL